MSTAKTSSQKTMSSVKTTSTSQLYLDELAIGAEGTLIVMLCRIWDVNAVSGRYLSRDFVICDAKGNTIHGTARSSVAHMFLKLQEGAIYAVKRFSVQPNKEDFRIYRDAPFMIEFDGDTVVRKAYVKPEGFIRFPFEFVELEDLELTNNKYMIDVVGYVTNVGRTTVQRSGSQTLDFYLANTRDHSVRVSMWGNLGSQLIEKRAKMKGPYAVVLTAMFVKIYSNKLYLSSSSSTLIMDDANIAELKALKPDESDAESMKQALPIDFSEPQPGTLENLLMWARNKKNDSAAFNCEVRIDRILTKRGWCFPACPGEKCKKQASRKLGGFWCDGCEKSVEYPVMRYRLEVEVSDDSTAGVVVVMFDEIASKLVNHSAESLFNSANQDEEDDSPLPTALTNVVGTTHALVLTVQSYFEHATYESFTCWKLFFPEEFAETEDAPVMESPAKAKSSLVIKPNPSPSMVTPSKVAESKRRRCLDIEDLDAECSGVVGDTSSTVDGVALSKKRLTKRAVLEETDIE